MNEKASVWWTTFSCTALKTPRAFCIEKPLCSSSGQNMVPRPHPLHHTGPNASRRFNSERSMSITQHWSNPQPRKPLIWAFAHSFHLMSHYLVHSSWIYAVRGYLMALQPVGKIQLWLEHTSYNSDTDDRKHTHWREQNHTLPQRPVTPANMSF